jgi:hypothetical protein
MRPSTSLDVAVLAKAEPKVRYLTVFMLKKPVDRPIDQGMDGVSGSSACDQAAVAVLAKDNDQKKQDARNAATLIESAMPKPLPPDATFSSYA